MEEQDYEDSDYTHLILCGEPTIIEGFRFAKDLLFVNIFIRLIIQYVKMPKFVKHNLSLLLGSFLLYNTVGFAFLWTAGLTISSYAILQVFTLCLKRRRGSITSVFVMSFLLASEFFFVNRKMWHQIRGIQMVAAMKIISVSIDLDKGFLLECPSPAEFAGYIICPANCILGPWVSFQKYCESLEVKYLTKTWTFQIVKYTLYSVIALFLSNCLVPWYISGDNYRWLIAYRDAQAFRMSHYFISLLSTAVMISAGYGEKDKGDWKVTITEPFFIEMPRSLVTVVVYWNMPMHHWLKTYVFKVFQPHGKFLAIFMTYIVSSLLHGLNFQLSATLLSIGMFSYLEYQLRTKVSGVFSVCCLATQCKSNCGHFYKKNYLVTRLLNIFFTFLTIVHLSYLGVMFEASFSLQESGYSYAHTMKKWAELDFGSHIIGIFTYLIYLIL